MKRTKIDYSKVLKLLDDGLNYEKIGQILNVKPGSISSYMVKHYGKVKRGNKLIELTSIQKELIFGSLLGDGHLNLSLKTPNPNYREEHSIKQYDYLKYKFSILKNLIVYSEVKIYNRFDDRFKIKNYQSCFILTQNNPCFIEFHKMFYKGKKKVIPQDLSLLTPLAIAIWFMDDGQKFQCGYGICTNSFELNDIQRICNYLKEKYNIYTTINKKKAIYIKACSKIDFTNLIKPYILPSLEYKLIK